MQLKPPQRRVNAIVETTIDEIEYVLHKHGPDPRHHVNCSELNLLTVIAYEGSSFEIQDLQSFIAGAEGGDDVFQLSFLESVIFLSAGQNQSINLGEGVKALLHSYGNRRINILKAQDLIIDSFPTGPYISYQEHLWQPWRVYSDTKSAFMASLEPHSSSVSERTAQTTLKNPNARIKVASRLYADKGSLGPLSGLRFAVKDCFDIEGVKTSLCNKAYFDLYPERAKTASAVYSFIANGASVVGKTKLSSLISKEDPTEAVDFSAPFNPRGDGYQSPAGSSSGSGAAVASYDWLDVAIGTDTNGSGRMPAIVNGCFGLRITHGVVDTAGLVLSFSPFDVPCLFGRDVKVLEQFTRVWLPLQDRQPIEKLPNRIVWLKDFLPISNPAQMKVMEKFTRDLESTLGVKRTEISLAETWSSMPPAAAGSETLDEFLDEAGWAPLFYDAYHNLDTFRKDYKETFDKKPYVTPYNRWKWALGSGVSPEQREDGLFRMRIYRTWLLEKIFGAIESDTILILAVHDGLPKYRDTQPQKPKLRNGASALYVSPILGAPEISVPIGQIPYTSEISGRTEQLPIGVSLIGAPGQDLMLLMLVEKCFNDSGRPSQVRTGSVMY